MEILNAVRLEIENEDGIPFRYSFVTRFDTFLMPEEGKEHTVLAEGGSTTREIDEHLQALLNETRDFLEW